MTSKQSLRNNRTVSFLKNGYFAFKLFYHDVSKLTFDKYAHTNSEMESFETVHTD